jgi:hypothetical protein
MAQDVEKVYFKALSVPTDSPLELNLSEGFFIYAAPMQCRTIIRLLIPHRSC